MSVGGAGMGGGPGARVVAEARGWLGTPYRHQGSARGVGCDCLGLIRGVWRAMAGADPEAMPRYTPDWGEPRGEEVLFAAAERHLVRVRDGTVAPGEVLLFRMRTGAVAKHLGIAAAGAAGPTFIHAMSGRGVVESPLSAPWRRRIAARFAFPDKG